MQDRLSGPVAIDDTAVTYGLEAFLPLPKEQRKGTALCLSGGGYRAALFHLGAMRRLNELGILAQLEVITSVSGGSIAAARLADHLATRVPHWPPPDGVVCGFEEGVAIPLRMLARKNIRRAAFARLKPRNLLTPGASIAALAECYARELTPLRFSELPRSPVFIFCATDMRFGNQWIFDSGRQRMGSERAGYVPTPPNWALARAVAASSSLPGVFSAMRVDAPASGPAAANGASTGRYGSIELTDGGMYDNLAVEPVWRDRRVVLISDGSPTFAGLQTPSPAWHVLRHFAVLIDQASEVRKRWLISSFLRRELDGAYWSIGSLPTSYGYDPGVPVYSDELINSYIAHVRIELDSFSPGEIGVLENHGYLLTDIAVQRHARELITQAAPGPRVPHPEWMSEERAREALAESDVIRPFGRRGVSI